MEWSAANEMDVCGTFAEILDFLLIDGEFRTPTGTFLGFADGGEDFLVVCARFGFVDVLQLDVVFGLRLHVPAPRLVMAVHHVGYRSSGRRLR